MDISSASVRQNGQHHRGRARSALRRALLAATALTGLLPGAVLAQNLAIDDPTDNQTVTTSITVANVILGTSQPGAVLNVDSGREGVVS